MRTLLLLLALSCIRVAHAQAEPDSVSTHSVRGATLRSAVLPGWGQIYNKKVWKAPIIWGGMGTCIYFINDNITQVNRFKTALIAEADSDPTTLNTTGYSQSQLENLLETYTRWRDLAFMSLGLVYLLNVVDAHVDAHLFYFDVGDDLTVHWHPALTPGSRAPGLGVSLTF